MRPFLAFLLVAALGIAPATAAERTLLSPLAAGATVGTTRAAAVDLDNLRQAATAKGRVRVIVGFRVPFAPEGTLATSQRLTQRREITAAAGSLRGRFAAAIQRNPAAVRSYATLPFMALEVTPDELVKLARDPMVTSITENIKLRANLAESAALIGAPQAWNTGYTGAGQTIAILDTGVDKDHPFLAGKVVSEACYSDDFCPGGVPSSTAPNSGRPCPLEGDACAHGTHVAGIAAGRGASFSGIAKDANIIAIQVFSSDPDDPTETIAWFSDVLAGLERVYELRNSYAIASINISIGGGRATATCDRKYREMTAVMANLRSAGIATIVASGNEGWRNATSFPACISQAVSVGAVSDSDWGSCDGRPTGVDKIACYSNSASFLSLLAPGSAISSSVPGGDFDTWHGTSMATPHVAGAWALMRQKYRNVPATEILAAFQASGKMVPDDRDPRNRKPVTKPRINVAAALNSLVPFTVGTDGTGSGSVSIATPRGTTVCSTSCPLTLATNTQVKLTAKPARGSRFTGWTGAACRNTVCTISLSSAQTVTATFTGR